MEPSKRWYEEYFGLPFVLGDNNTAYDRTIKDRIRLALESVESFISPSSGKILDMPCGYGKHSIELAQRGFDVTGADLCDFHIKLAVFRSENNLDVYEEKAYDLRRIPVFLVADMIQPRQLGKFNAILNMGWSFGFFSPEENLKVLTNYREMLESGGLLLIHTITSENLGAYLQDTRRTVLPTKAFGIQYPSGTLHFKKRREKNILCTTWQVDLQDGRRFPPEPVEADVIMYSVEELSGLCECAGLKPIRVVDTHFPYKLLAAKKL